MAPNEQPSPPGEARQLRIALVLYGGVSLAIYMHGSTKELHRLVRASALLEQGVDPDRPGEVPSPVERVYMRLLERMRQRDDVHTRVVVDVISGTSAGGINGVYLAKAVAHNQSQDALRQVWLEEGDINRLLWGPRWLPGRLKQALAALRALFRPVLVGDRMSRLLKDALDRMDRAPAAPATLPSLMPPDQELQLFVTTTDFWGSPRQVMIDDPVQVADRAHRALLEFRHVVGGVDQLSRRHNPVLAFAARATSCFPGAFPPVCFAEFQRLVGAGDDPLAELAPDFARAFELAGVDPARAWLIDGGVLDNRPFGHALRAIRGKPARTEVDRRLVYLEPDPPSDYWVPGTERPGQLGTVLGALSGIPRHEPILDDLLGVAALNERVWRIRRVIETSFEAIAERVSTLLEVDLRHPEAAGPEQVAAWRARLREEAGTGAASLGYATYLRLRITAAVDRFADATRAVARYPQDSSNAQLLRAVFRHWVGDELGLLEPGDEKQDARLAFLRDFDLDYAERLLRFLIAGVNWWYRDLREKRPSPSREQLDEAKRLLYRRLEELERVTRPEDAPPAVTEAVREAFPEAAVRDFLRREGLAAARYATDNQAPLTRLDQALREHVRQGYSGFAAGLYEPVLEATAGWSPDLRRRFLVRYLGFPLWDPILFPIQSLADAGERDRVEVQRWSPGGRRVLAWRGEGPKLTGTTVGHFGAFLDRGGRERDYLWGRLDAAERLVQLLVPGRDDAAETVQGTWLTAAAAAILEEEAPHLPRARELIADLRAQLGQS